MSISLESARTIANQLPLGSLTDVLFKNFNSIGWLNDPTGVAWSRLEEKTVFAVAQVALRAGSCFLYPRLSTAVALVNVSIGIFHLGLGGVEIYRSGIQNIQPDDNTSNMHKGLVHLMTAIYDYLIGRILMKKVVNLAYIARFAMQPNTVFQQHVKIFAKPDKEPVIDYMKLSSLIQNCIEKIQSTISEGQPNRAQIIENITQSLRRGLVQIHPSRIPTVISPTNVTSLESEGTFRIINPSALAKTIIATIERNMPEELDKKNITAPIYNILIEAITPSNAQDMSPPLKKGSWIDSYATQVIRKFQQAIS